MPQWKGGVNVDITSMIIGYEMGALTNAEIVQLFAKLIISNLAWTLQGHYGRQANAFIKAGFITEKGEITAKGEAV